MKKRLAFTLVELLVVVAIIAVLMALLLPSLAKAKKQARVVMCGSNLHQYGLAMATYQAEYRNYFPLFGGDIGDVGYGRIGNNWCPWSFDTAVYNTFFGSFMNTLNQTAKIKYCPVITDWNTYGNLTFINPFLPITQAARRDTTFSPAQTAPQRDL